MEQYPTIRKKFIWFTALLRPCDFDKVPHMLRPRDGKPIFIDLRDNDNEWELSWAYRHFSNNPTHPAQKNKRYEASKTTIFELPRYFEEWIDVSYDETEYDLIQHIVVDVDTLMRYADKLLHG